MNKPAISIPESKPRSKAPLILLILFAPALCCGLQAALYALWSSEQVRTSAALKDLAQTDAFGLAALAALASIVTGALWGFVRDERFRPVFAGWFGASLIAFPGIALRFVGPNNDQLGMLVQIAICWIGIAVAWILNRNKMPWNWGMVPAALMTVAVGVYPLVRSGALGSPGDLGLALVAGLSFGLLASLLIHPTTGNVWTDALGIFGALILLAMAFGYDGGQLILLAALPFFALALSVLMPSRAAVVALVGLIVAAVLAFIDPTELHLVLSDFTAIGLGMAYSMLGLGLITGLAALAASAIFQRVGEAGWKRPVSLIGAGILWAGTLAAYLLAGHRGFYGDRIFVILKEQADLSTVEKITDREYRLTAAYNEMVTLADKTQAPLRKNLDTFGVKYTPYYLVNAMEVQGGMLTRLYLALRPEVDRVIPSPRLRPIPPINAGQDSSISAPGETQWNVQMIGADKVWQEFDAYGQGIVVGQSDTGVDVGHPALSDQYRGSASGDHDYNWFDPWYGAPSPVDTIGHGTHTLGTILGQGGIGIAPEAQWFACANLRRNLANPSLYLDCMQFMLAPFPVGGDPFTDGDPTMAAHVINNSWGCPELEGCDPGALQAAAEHLRAAGIFVAVSAGNDGPDCNTVKDPLAIYDAVFSVGAIDQSGTMAYFSSRGPVTVDGSNRIKPDLAAPGVTILSSMPGGSYSTMDGTSMAGPHVVGAVALLWSAVPSLIGDIDVTEQILIQSAQPYAGSTGFGCFSGDIPNAAYGYGVLNVYEAVKLALEK